MALIYSAERLQLLRKGAKENPSNHYYYDIHPRIHNIDNIVARIYEELEAIDAILSTLTTNIGTQVFTATDGQTNFTVTNFTVNNYIVFVNGKFQSFGHSATGNVVIFTQGMNEADEVMVQGIN